VEREIMVKKVNKFGHKLPQPSNPRHQSPNYVFPFEKLDVWQRAVELADYVLRLLERIPQNKHFRLVSQMEGAVTSIPQNIAEGKGRQYKKEFIQYLSIAQGSLYEVITLNEVFKRRNLFNEAESSDIRERGEEIDRKLNGLMNAIRGRKRQIQ
jgi:four helix bundle protein